MTPKDRRELIDALADGEVSEAEFLTAEAELSIDGDVRREYYDRVILTMLLESEAKAAGFDGITPVAKGNDHRLRLALTAMILATAASLIAVAVLVMQGDRQVAGTDLPTPTTNASTSEASASGFAVVSGQSGVEWADRVAIANGSLVPEGQLHLRSGIVHLELFSGVQLVVEGESKFAILSPMEVRVAKGKVRAQVPEPAIGFKIHTDAGNVVDLGTDFAVNVTDQGAEVHVIDGEVEWTAKGDQPKRMETGNAVATSKGGNTVNLVTTAGEFIGPSEFQQRMLLDQDERYTNWKAHSERLRQDPRLVALYQVGMTDRWARRLRNHATASIQDETKQAAGEGAVVAAVRTADRWGRADGALDFSPTGSRVRLTVPGEYQSLTLMCWVRINSLDRWYNSLFLTDGHEKGEPHWQIMDDGRLFFSVKKNDVWNREKGQKDKHVFYSPSLEASQLCSQWSMIATVYDTEAKQVTHYLNGKAISKEAIPEEYLVRRVRIGDASLCNWGLPERDEPRFAVRNLNGSMDEFALFSAALSSDEIKDLYEHGKP